jgi:hypothetical protein
MEINDVKDFVSSLGVDLPPLESFWRLGDLTALRQDRRNTYYRSNYERGILLYALTAHYHPLTVLEFGTGRGYGCMCMAWAMEDHKIPGRIYTIDLYKPNEIQEWPIDWDDGRGPHTEFLSRDQVWAKAVSQSWLNRIEQITGLSGQAMRHYQGSQIELAFIDGGHGYASVRHDFYSMIRKSAPRFGILLDDYAPEPGFGVQKLIDEEVSPYFRSTLIYPERRWLSGNHASLNVSNSGMIWVHSDSLNRSVASIYPESRFSAFLIWYRFYEQLLLLRSQVGRTARRLLRHAI